MKNPIKRFINWLDNTKWSKQLDHFFMYGYFKDDDLTPQDIEDMKKYWKYQENPDDPELKEFGEEYARKIKEEQWKYDRKIYIMCISEILICVFLLFMIYSSSYWGAH